MEIEILNTSTLKPSPPHSTPNVHIPLTIFDEAAFDLHVPTIYAFLPPTPSNAEMKQGLAKALSHFPHLAGRLSVGEEGRPGISLNDAGICLIEASVNMRLADRLPLNPCPELCKLHPSIDGPVEELLQIQLNRFSCGGLVVGVTAHHRVADGQSMSFFFLAWAKLVRGLTIDPRPYHDRAAISVPRNPPRCEFNHQASEFRENAPAPNSKGQSAIENVHLQLSAGFVAKLKAHVEEEDPGRRFSTFECLLAHVWKKITLARGLPDDEMTQVRVAVNGRARIKPGVPMEYFGNLVLWAYPRLTVRDLLDGSHAFVAKTIRDAVTKIDDAYFKSFIDFGELRKKGEDKGIAEMRATAPEIGDSLCPNLEVDSWLRFQFHGLDFGAGGPCAVLVPLLPVEGLLIFMPSCTEKGGINVHTCLLPDHVDRFKQACYSLD
ncbi:hypothetical protein ACLOJK_015719 [Asimina triloba]